MSSLSFKLLALVLVSAFALALPADAKTRKHKKTTVASQTPTVPSGVRTWFARARCISAASILAMILIRTSVFRSCAISRAGLAETPTDGRRRLLRRFCSRLIFAV